MSIMMRKSQAVMLPTTGISHLRLNTIHNNLFYDKEGADIPTQLKQHIYILSDEEIKEGDWFYKKATGLAREGEIAAINNDKEGIFKCNTYDEDIAITYNGRSFDKSYCWKIIGTTDPELIAQGVPCLSSDFIQAYIRAYNAGTSIVECMVEYETEYIDTSGPGWTSMVGILKPKLRQPENSLIIHPVKVKTYTENDLREAFRGGRRLLPTGDEEQDYLTWKEIFDKI